jgi:hypothetical protein
VPKDVTKAIAQLIPNLSDPFIRSPAMRARVAPVLHKSDLSVLRAEHVVVVVIDRAIELAA